MSKKDENINKYIKKKNRNIINNISDDLDFSNDENSKENNSYSISGQNINKKNGMKNSSFFLNNSHLTNSENNFDYKNNDKNIKELNLSNTSSNNSKNKTSKSINTTKNNINNIYHDVNTAGKLLLKSQSNSNIIKIKNKKTKIKALKKMQTIKTEQSLSLIDEEDNQLTIRQRLTQFFELNDRLFYLKIIVSALAAISYIYYIVCTYKRNLFKSLNYIDYFICSLVIIEHIINILLAHHIFLYLISIDSLINFVIEIPPFFSFMCSDYYLDKTFRFINITRVIRLTKSYIIIDIIQSREKSVNVKKQIFNIVFSILLIILIFAGVIQMLDIENVIEQLKIEFKTENRLNLKLRQHFHHYLYFIIVSLTTVGYGEIKPMSILSQIMIIALVIVILLVIPDQTTELINLSNAQTIYERKEYISSDDVPFVVLIGNIGLDALKSFCEEYFHKDHGKFYRHIVILVNKFPDKQFESFLNEKDNNKFIYYLQGDPMKNYDLLRTDILKAKSCIIFSNKNTRDPFSEDQRALLLAIFVKKFYYLTSLENNTKENNKEIDVEELSQINSRYILKNNNFKIFLQLNKSESSQYYYSTLQTTYRKNMSKDQLLIIETLKMNLLSKSCLTPGIISLLSNLIISSSTGKIVSKNEPEWLREYSEGTQYEIYKFSSEGQLLNFTYQQLALEIYNKFHSILIALEINFRGNILVKLNPQSNDSIYNIIDKALFLKSKKMRNGEDGQLYSASSEEESNNISINDETENKTEQILKIMKLRKQVKINFYLISRDKEIIDEILKMDFYKDNDILKEKKRKSMMKLSLLTSFYNFEDRSGQQPSSLRKLSVNSDHLKKNLQKRLQKKILYLSEDEKVYSDASSLSDEEIDTKGYLSELVNNGNKFNEYEQIINNYYTLEGLEKNYLNTNEIMRQGIKDRNDIQHHVIICGMHSEIIHFILPLRAKYLAENMLKWIVILAPVLPQEIHDALSIFPKIIFIQGDPLHPENLFRANITTADIAVILSSTFSGISKNNENNDFSSNYHNNNEESNSFSNFSDNNFYFNKLNKNKLHEEILDSTTLFIYKTIRKINHSIKIITELLITKNIEFLLSSKYIKKLYDQTKKHIYNNNNNKYNDTGNQKENDNINPNYEMTPVFASGEIYLPSLVDKIIAQMFFNSNLLTILKLLLEGEKQIMKKKEKKLNKLFNLTGSNLFLIPCEIRNESFGEMFKRILSKNGMLCLALYRKDVIDNFYYVYTNPRKTTLVRETDFVFVLSGTENIESLFDKNIFNISNKKEEDDGYNNNENNEINVEENNNIGKPSIFQVLQESIQKQFVGIKGNKSSLDNTNTINNDDNEINIDSIYIYNNKNESEDKEMSRNNIKIEESKKNRIYSKFKEDKNNNNINNNDKKNYSEVEELQQKVNKSMERLKIVSQKTKEFEKEIYDYIQEEIHNEFLVYLNKIKQK